MIFIVAFAVAAWVFMFNWKSIKPLFATSSIAQLYSFRFLELNPNPNPNPNPSMGFAHLLTHALTQTHASRIKYNRPHVLRVEYIIWWLSVYYFTVFGHRFVSFIVTLWCVCACVRAVVVNECIASWGWDVVCALPLVRSYLSVVQLLAIFFLYSPLVVIELPMREGV